MIDIDDQEEDRKRYSDKIINSPAKKKIIVAGTGKTIMGCTPVSIQLVKKQYLKLSVFSPPFPFLSPFPSRSL